MNMNMNRKMKASKAEVNSTAEFFKNYWNSYAVAKHRRGISDFEWAARQRRGKPRYKIGDVVEFKEGGFGVIHEVSEPHGGWPSSYATRNVPGMKPFWKVAWHYEGDFKRMVAKGALHAIGRT